MFASSHSHANLDCWNHAVVEADVRLKYSTAHLPMRRDVLAALSFHKNMLRPLLRQELSIRPDGRQLTREGSGCRCIARISNSLKRLGGSKPS